MTNATQYHYLFKLFTPTLFHHDPTNTTYLIFSLLTTHVVSGENLIKNSH